MEKSYYVYIMTNVARTVLYIGMTSDLAKRVWEHKNSVVKSFTEKYSVNRLVYYEEYGDVWDAITREKRLKK